MPTSKRKITIKNFALPDKSSTFLDGSRRDALLLQTCAIGLTTCLPGWRWSKHVGKLTGKISQSHIGYIISGTLAIQAPDGTKHVVCPGAAFEVGPGHDAWVVGDEPCVTIDFSPLSQ